tara:strand:- start:617 stop:907 length:291 start_codon:yes stop_codon:yes gene_type:complete
MYNKNNKNNKKYGGNLIKMGIPLIIILSIIGGLGYYYFFIYGNNTNNTNNTGNNKQQIIPNEIPRKSDEPLTELDIEDRSLWSPRSRKNFEKLIVE